MSMTSMRLAVRTIVSALDTPLASRHITT